MESPVNESHNKENGLVDPQSTRTTSPRKTPPLQPSPTEVDNQEDSSVTSSIVPDEPKAAPISATDSYIEEVATPPSVEPCAEVASVPKIEKSVSDILVKDWEVSDESVMDVDPCVPEKPKELASEASSASTDCIEASNQNSAPIETIDPTCTLKTGDVDIPVADVVVVTTPAVIQVTEESNIVKTSPLTSEQQY